MTENQSRERSLTSPCGNVTVTVDPGSSPKVELAPGAERMFARDLAELTTKTARDAVDRAMAETEIPADVPTADAAADELSRFRDSLRDQGLASTIDRRRTELEVPEDRVPPEDFTFGETPAIALSELAMRELDSSIELLRRLGDGQTASGTGSEGDEPVGKATSPSKLVVVESTLRYPIASVWLSKRACEIGPKALGAEINETAEAAAEDLARTQGDYFAGLGLPTGPAGITEMAKVLGDHGKRAGADAADIQQRQQEIIRSFKEGGYIG